MGQELSTWRCVDSIPSFWNISRILPWTLSRILSESTDMYLLDGCKVKVIDEISCISYTELWMHCFCEKVRRMFCQASQRCFLPLVFCKRITASMQSAKANKECKNKHTHKYVKLCKDVFSHLMVLVFCKKKKQSCNLQRRTKIQKKNKQTLNVREAWTKHVLSKSTKNKMSLVYRTNTNTNTHRSEPVNIDIISSRSRVGSTALLKLLLDPGEGVRERVLLQHCLKKSPRVRNG